MHLQKSSSSLFYHEELDATAAALTAANIAAVPELIIQSMT